MDERQQRALAVRALRRLRKVVLEEAFALDALASPDGVVQSVIEVLRAVELTASTTERAADAIEAELVAAERDRERLQ